PIREIPPLVRLQSDDQETAETAAAETAAAETTAAETAAAESSPVEASAVVAPEGAENAAVEVESSTNVEEETS
ncbi:MAG TPA: hypothetical protein QF764_07930, partial [Planctomycetota bacterium]|nr:hypothetical protein [Planctomycetota bacterium]